MSKFDWTSKWMQYQPEKIAFEEFESGRKLSWKQLNTLGNYFAQELISNLKLKKGDRLAILSENRLELITLFVVAQKTGIILVPLNYRLTAPEINYLLQQSMPAAIWYEQQFEDKLLKTEQFGAIPTKQSLENLAEESNKVLASNKNHHFENIAFEENHQIF